MHRFNHRGSWKHLLSPAEHSTYVKWARGVAALYGSVALLTVIGLAALQHRSNGPEAAVGLAAAVVKGVSGL
jgi:hypothetical protein